MSTLALNAGLPWALAREEDRRFHRILLQTLVVCVAVGAITPYIRLPPPDADVAEDLPARRVHLLAEQDRPAPGPAAVSIPVPAAPAVTAPAKPQAVAEPLPVAPVVTPRQKAARSGVLAMSAALSALQARTPKTGTRQGQENAAGEVHATPPQPSMLTANVTRGSKGIAGGVAHESVLGASGLPDREDSRQGAGSRAGRAATRGRTGAPPPGLVRSEEEIQEVLDRNKGAMYTLYNRELRKETSLQGKVVMRITIAPAGNVTRCVILSSELDSASLERQLVALIKRIDFGNKPGVPAVTTKIPIEFFPR
jgi:TonB family protein